MVMPIEFATIGPSACEITSSPSWPFAVPGGEQSTGFAQLSDYGSSSRVSTLTPFTNAS
jgi:hypothetical protein